MGISLKQLVFTMVIFAPVSTRNLIDLSQNLAVKKRPSSFSFSVPDLTEGGVGRDDTCAAGFRPWNPTDSRFPAAVMIVAVSVVGSFSGSAPSYHSSIIRLGPLPAVDYFSRCWRQCFILPSS